MTNLLGPLTRMLLKTALNSLPRRMSMLSIFSGSRGGVAKPSPKSPAAKAGRSFSTDWMMHSSGRGRLREQVWMVEAGKGK